MTIQEATEDIKIGVTKRESLGLAVRALESFKMMEEYIKDRADKAANEEREAAYNECLDLIKSTQDMIEKKD